jgi:hypothetical protein
LESCIDLDICVAEELTHHINVALGTSQMEGRPATLTSKIDLDICAAEELTHHFSVAHLTSHVEGHLTILIS